MTRWVPLAGAALLLSGCAHRVGDVTDGLTNAERQARLAAITDWSMDGVLHIDTGEDRYRASVNWEQQDAHFVLLVRGGPLGVAGGFRVRRDASSLTIEQGGEIQVLDDPEGILVADYGWWLPVSSLGHWLLGRPDPDFARRLDRGPGGTLAELEQRDWRIVYEEYQLIDALLIPRRLKLEHSTLELDLRVDDFEPAGS